MNNIQYSEIKISFLASCTIIIQVDFKATSAIVIFCFYEAYVINYFSEHKVVFSLYKKVVVP